MPSTKRYAVTLFLHGYAWLNGLVLLPQASEFDDMRQCFGCKAICVFSAVACECDKSRVSCMRHFPTMCKCPAHKKFMLGKLSGVIMAVVAVKWSNKFVNLYI
jgi:hypothetical protein